MLIEERPSARRVDNGSFGRPTWAGGACKGLCGAACLCGWAERRDIAGDLALSVGGQRADYARRPEDNVSVITLEPVKGR